MTDSAHLTTQRGRLVATAFGEFDRPVRSLQLHQILRLVRRRKRFIAAAAIAGTLLTAVAAFAVPPSYTATAQLLLEPSSSEISAGLIEPVVDTHIAKLTSDARLRHMLANLSGHAALNSSVEAANATPNFEQRVRGWLGEITGGLRRIATGFSQPNPTEQVATDVPTLEQLKKMLLVRQERRSNIVAISYTDRSPEKAALIANQIVLFHVQQLQELRQADSERLQAWLDERIAAVRADLEEADRVVRAQHAAYGVKSADAIGADAIADTIRQVAVLQAEISERQARRNRLSVARAETHDEQTGATRTDETPANGPAGRGGNAEPEQNGASANEQSAQALAQLDREIRVLQSQLRSLEQRLEGLRAAASSSLEQQMQGHLLELRAASAKKLLDDLVRRQQEVSEAAHARSVGARVLALAPTPLRPSSISPYLLIPPAVFAFALLGGAISVFRARLNPTLQSEREVIAELGISSLGAIPQVPSSRRAPDYRELVDRRSQPFSQGIRSTAISALNVISPRNGARVILVTPCVSKEAATATALSMSLGVCIARLGNRVLVIAFGALDGSSEPVLDGGSAERGAQLHDQSISAAVQHDAQLGLDCFSVRQISGDPMSLVASQQFADILHRLKARYDCIIIDAPSVFSSAEVRLLATKVDGTILAIKWGSTHRDAAANASQLLRQVSPYGEPAAKVYAVLTDVDATARAEFDR